ncbi:tetratricopeptide repeat protein [Streptomyces coelicoflavus]|uniref:tetratricopeptide repeat protein n=1 Tax=Streptomyces coelicoflavus TaxID=285562 RepID=UPI003674A58F
MPDVGQREGKAVEPVQLSGEVNPGSGRNQYVMDLRQHPPHWLETSTSPWGGLSGAALFCDRLLVGVVASDRAHSGSGQLNVVPAYVLFHDPDFRAALAGHDAASTGLEAVEFQHLADPGVGPGRPGSGVRSPVALLEARRQTIPFHGRQELLEELSAWCARDGFGAWLLHGPGGQGKTRLAHHLAALLAAERWAVLWPRPDATADQLREIRHTSKPLLVVLDYAETRPGQLAAIVEAAADHPGTTPLKVLLLARTDGDWWREATTSSSLAQDYLDNAPTSLLGLLEDDPANRLGAYHDAVRALGNALPHVDGVSDYDWSTVAKALHPPRLKQDAYGNALTLQMTALADLLDTATGTEPATPARSGHRGAARKEAEGVEDRLLRHERRYWKQSAAAHGLTPGLSTSTLETALAAAHLAGAADREHADLLWCRLPALADQPRDRRNQVTTWIAALYPTDAADRPWGALQPDRIAERHIGRTLDDSPTLADNVLDGADDPQASQLLTVYSRAAAHPVFRHRLDTLLTALCTRHYRRFGRLIVTTATRTDHPAPLAIALDIITNDARTPLGDLTTLYNQFPYPSRRLAEGALRLAQTIVSRYRAFAKSAPEAHLPDLALALNNLSVRLGAAGRRGESLTVAQESVDSYRALAKANRALYLPDLATSLNNLSAGLGEIGRWEEAGTVGQEAVDIRRALVNANPDAYLADLATSLSNLFVYLGAVGRREEGLTVMQEAVHSYRVLAEADPNAHLPNLAAVLSNLSAGLGEIGQEEEGLAAGQEAVDILRVLVDANPDTYLADLAMSLNNLSIRLGALGRREEGLTAVQEAVDHYRVLAKANPNAHLPNLAMFLNNLSVDLGAVGRREEALAAIREAVEIRRALVRANRMLFESDLRQSMGVMSWLETLPQ